MLCAVVQTTYGCLYLEDHDSCDFTTTQGLNIMKINTQDIGEYESVEVRVSTPQGDTHLLEEAEDLRTTQSASFYQYSIFNTFGVYTYDVEIILEDGSSTVERTYTLLYDDSNPLPPVIENVEEAGDNIEVDGFVNFPQVISEIVYYNNGVEIDSSNVDENGEFQFQVPNDGINYIELKSINTNGKESLHNQYMHYSQDFDSNNIEVATVTSVDFTSNNENIKEQNQEIITKSPIHHISGTAESGNVVFVQGVPIPVINDEFQAILYLNEGEDEVCVIGNNQVCQTFVTIYSYANNEFSLNTQDPKQINLNNLNSQEFISKLRVQGEDSVTSSNYDVSTTQLSRDIFFVEIMAPGVYEKKYIIEDREDPSIEILSQDELYSSSKVGIKFSDDIGVDLESLTVRIGNEQYRYEDALDTQSLGKVNYVLFNPPNTTQSNAQIEAYVQDTSGNSQTATKSINLYGGDIADLEITLGSDQQVIGDEIYVAGDEKISFTIKDNDQGSEIGRPIALDIAKINDFPISDYSISEENEIQFNVDLSLLELQDEYSLTIPVVLYGDVNNQNSQIVNVEYNIIDISNQLEVNKNYRIIEKYVSDNIVIVELLNERIDPSSIRVDGSTDAYFMRGDYVFINMNDKTQAQLSFSDLSGNFKEYRIDTSSNKDINFEQVSSGNFYNTYQLNSQSSGDVYFLDLFMSKRGGELVSIPSQRQLYLPSSFVEGLSVLENSVISYSKKNPVFKTQILEDFSFSNYPTTSIPSKNVFYRGLRKYTDSNTGTIQGRILGNQEISQVSADGKNCRVEERFFVCQDIELTDFNNLVNINFYDENGDSVDVGGDTTVDDGTPVVVIDEDGNPTGSNNPQQSDDGDGNTIITDENGDPVVTDEDGDSRIIIDDNQDTVIIDDNGNPVTIDDDGNPTGPSNPSLSTDEDGNTIIVDPNGDPLITDNNGNPIITIDEDGNVVVIDYSDLNSNGDTVPITNTNQTPTSLLELDLNKNNNVILTSEGFTFTSGDLTFDFTPNIDGEHRLFLNGELISTFSITDDSSLRELTLEEDDYLNSDSVGQEWEVYVQDDNDQSSNSLSLRFSRILTALLEIVVN